MIREGYDAFDDPYLYPGTTVLRNLRDIRDEKALEAFEVEVSTLRAEQPLPDGEFDAPHYCALHHHLFPDVYGWAGNYRTVRIAKSDSIFAFRRIFRSRWIRFLGTMAGGERFRDCAPDEFVAVLAKSLAELNAIHPFSEGNGRTQLAFAALIGHTFDHPLHLEHVEQGTFLAAMVASFAGELGPLIAALKELRA
jgi:cell filamentation protein